MSSQAWLLLFTLGFIWGGTFYFTEIMLLAMTPLHIVFFRVTIAATFMLAFIYLRGKRLPTDTASIRQFAIMGLFNNALPFSLITLGQQYITAGLASILNAFTAFVTVIVAGLILSDERITAPRLIGTALGVSGVAVAMGIDNLSTLSLTSLGQFMVLGATCCYAVASMFARLQMSKLDAEVSATGMLCAASVWILIISLIFEGTPQLAMNTAPILAILALAIPCTSVAYIVYFMLVKRAGAGNTMLVTIIIPPIALMLDSIILNEALRLREVAGFFIISIGMLLLSGKLPLFKRRT